jgi:hypothetical protein
MFVDRALRAADDHEGSVRAMLDQVVALSTALETARRRVEMGAANV